MLILDPPLFLFLDFGLGLPIGLGRHLDLGLGAYVVPDTCYGFRLGPTPGNADILELSTCLINESWILADT